MARVPRRESTITIEPRQLPLPDLALKLVTILSLSGKKEAHGDPTVASGSCFNICFNSSLSQNQVPFKLIPNTRSKSAVVDSCVTLNGDAMAALLTA